MNVDVVVVGGGIAGLSTAYELSRRGVSFVVLEGAARAGGVILSEEIDGFTIDAGPDSLLVQKPAGIALCQLRRLRRASSIARPSAARMLPGSASPLPARSSAVP